MFGMHRIRILQVEWTLCGKDSCLYGDRKKVMRSKQVDEGIDAVRNGMCQPRRTS